MNPVGSEHTQMPCSLVSSTQPTATTVNLLNGLAEYMGDGLFIILQADAEGVPQSAVLTEGDLRSMLAAI